MFNRFPVFTALQHKTLRTSLFVLTLFSMNALADIGPPIRASYSAEQISPSTYVIHGPVETPNPVNQGFMNNPGFVVADDGIIIIDSGSTLQVGKMVLDVIKTVSDKPVIATFSTHIHGDHWLGNQAVTEAFPDVKHYAHASMIEAANNGHGKNWVSLMLSLTHGASAGTQFIAPTEPIDNGESVTISGKTFTAYYGHKAHTQTDIAVRFNDENVLFLGDTTMNNALRRIDDGSFKGLISFLDRMLALDAETFVPGHGQTGDRSVVERFQWMLKTVFDTVKKEYDNGLSDFEIKPIVEKKLLENGPWVDLKESLGKVVSIAYLEVEEDSF